jgi:hypothetical protein
LRNDAEKHKTWTGGNSMKTIQFLVYSLILLPAFVAAQEGGKINPQSGEKNDWYDFGGGEGEWKYYDYRDQKVELQDRKRDAESLQGKDCDGQYVESGQTGEGQGYYRKTAPNAVAVDTDDRTDWSTLPEIYEDAGGVQYYRLRYRPVTGDHKANYGVSNDEIVLRLLEVNATDVHFLKNNEVYVETLSHE